MIEAQRPGTAARLSLVDSIRIGQADAEAQFRTKFRRGLLFLAKRHCPNHAEECFETTLRASIAALQNQVGLTDDELPAIILYHFRQASARFARCEHPRLPSPIPDAGLDAELEKRLASYTPLERRILVRHYLEGRDPSAICQELQVAPEVVAFVCAAARMAVRPYLRDLETAPQKIAASRTLRSFSETLAS